MMMGRTYRHVRGQWAGVLALFLVLAGGTAYAADSVLSSDIKDGEVKTADLGNSAVTNAKLAASSVNTGKVQDGTLQAKDLAPGVAGGATPIVFAPSNGSCVTGDPLTPACSVQQSLPGGLVLSEKCFGGPGGTAEELVVNANGPAGSIVNYAYYGGDASSQFGQAPNGLYGGHGIDSSPSGHFVLDSATVTSNDRQQDGQIVYRNGSTVVSITFSAFISQAGRRCEFIANAVS
jgi:hypothetical protein